jgi:hypothetical protein
MHPPENAEASRATKRYDEGARRWARNVTLAFDSRFIDRRRWGRLQDTNVIPTLGQGRDAARRPVTATSSAATPPGRKLRSS